MRARGAAWAWVVVGSAVAAALVVALAAPVPVRAPVAIWFLLTGPGMALVGLVGLEDTNARIAVSLVASVALDAAVAQTMIIAHAWSPGIGLAVLIAVSLLCGGAQLVLLERRAQTACERDQGNEQAHPLPIAPSRLLYVWVDAIDVVPREAPPVSLLVAVGARESGRKELLALGTGSRGSGAAWQDVLRAAATRPGTSPRLIIGDARLGLWPAVPRLFPGAHRQAARGPAIAALASALPKPMRAWGKDALAQALGSADRASAERAVAKLRDELAVAQAAALAVLDAEGASLLRFYDFPREHWRHIRSTNTIRSSAPRIREQVASERPSPSGALAIARRELEAAQARWSRLPACELAPGSAVPLRHEEVAA